MSQEGTLLSSGHLTETRQPDVYSAACPTRQLLDRVADKWTVLVLTLLQDEPMRFNALRRRIDGVSQKMLSQTLRRLERDGLVTRTVTPTVPVSVSYALTPLGGTLVEALQAMIVWAEDNMGEVAEAQLAHDARRLD
ncbi:MAG: helix-turn-helix domain-containing protein [Brevundimonas sp.]|uniref:winged helix-turn-helix transcriptional regulator n=1 Tax=Brevundimonas sp. TaxID=1871086 RepID=UPI002ABB390F|nr:helix-turn-helix domain-containing protein [Brevundimonas sp.]MDZ4111485.1 helix-turn-helix domain-containing protein [Brevundimonas sp.]